MIRTQQNELRACTTTAQIERERLTHRYQGHEGRHFIGWAGLNSGVAQSGRIPSTHGSHRTTTGTKSTVFGAGTAWKLRINGSSRGVDGRAGCDGCGAHPIHARAVWAGKPSTGARNDEIRTRAAIEADRRSGTDNGVSRSRVNGSGFNHREARSGVVMGLTTMTSGVMGAIMVSFVTTTMTAFRMATITSVVTPATFPGSVAPSAFPAAAPSFSSSMVTAFSIVTVFLVRIFHTQRSN